MDRLSRRYGLLLDVAILHRMFWYTVENEMIVKNPVRMEGRPGASPEERSTRAGVAKAHPHRFRDTLAVDMLSLGASPYDVAKILGDTIDTVERHYTPFVKELRERVRDILNSDAGLEKSVTLPSQFPVRIN